MLVELKELTELTKIMEKEGVEVNQKNVNKIIEIMATLKRYDALEDKSFEKLMEKAIQCFKLF